MCGVLSRLKLVQRTAVGGARHSHNEFGQSTLPASAWSHIFSTPGSWGYDTTMTWQNLTQIDPMQDHNLWTFSFCIFYTMPPGQLVVYWIAEKNDNALFAGC